MLTLIIREKMRYKHFCFKDPRFSYTLQVWRKYLKNTSFICVFRHPSQTVSSILSEYKREEYLHSLRLDKNNVLKVWETMYDHILEIHSKHGNWMFIHYDQMFAEKTYLKIERFLDVKIDREFPDKRLQTIKDHDPDLPEESLNIYNKLCRLANFQNNVDL